MLSPNELKQINDEIAQLRGLFFQRKKEQRALAIMDEKTVNSEWLKERRAENTLALESLTRRVRNLKTLLKKGAENE